MYKICDNYNDLISTIEQYEKVYPFSFPNLTEDEREYEFELDDIAESIGFCSNYEEREFYGEWNGCDIYGYYNEGDGFFDVYLCKRTTTSDERMQEEEDNEDLNREPAPCYGSDNWHWAPSVGYDNKVEGEDYDD